MAGLQYKGPVFRAIGTGKMSDIKLSGYTGDIVSDIIAVSKLDEYGYDYKDLNWFDMDDPDNEGEKLYYGWYDYSSGEPEDCNDDPLEAGEGLYVYPQEDAVGLSLTSSGEVVQEGVAYTIGIGLQYVANAAPIDGLTFGDIRVDNYTGDIVSDIIAVSRLNEYGYDYKDLNWFDMDDPDNEGEKLYYGWYDYSSGEPEDCNADPVASGEGLYLYPQEDAIGMTIVFPGIN